MTQQKTREELEAELAQLRDENLNLKKKQGTTLSLKIAPKGGISVYGLGRFPITLYRDQWSRLLEFAPSIKKFIEEHEHELKNKP